MKLLFKSMETKKYNCYISCHLDRHTFGLNLEVFWTKRGKTLTLRILNFELFLEVDTKPLWKRSKS